MFEWFLVIIFCFLQFVLWFKLIRDFPTKKRIKKLYLDSIREECKEYAMQNDNNIFLKNLDRNNIDYECCLEDFFDDRFLILCEKTHYCFRLKGGYSIENMGVYCKLNGIKDCNLDKNMCQFVSSGYSYEMECKLMEIFNYTVINFYLNNSDDLIKKIETKRKIKDFLIYYEDFIELRPLVSMAMEAQDINYKYN